MGSNEFPQTEEFHSKEALFGNMVKPVWDPSTLLEKVSGRLCLINQGLKRDIVGENQRAKLYLENIILLWFSHTLPI